MSDVEDFDVEHSKHSVTKNSLTFLLEGIDPRDLAADGLSIISFADSELDMAGGVREAPTCQELAIEGECLTKQGEHREAIPLLESALELGTDDLQLSSVLWSLLGNAHFYLGDYEKAAVCHQHDLAICNELGDERNQAQAYCNLGIANRKTGYLRRAQLCYERYLDICDKMEDTRSISKAHHNLGDLHLTLARLKLHRDRKLENSPEARDHLEKAAEYFVKHLDYVHETNNKSAQARAHASLGYVYELLQDTDKAIDHYEQRLRIAVENSDKGAEARSYCSIGNCLRAMIQPDKALECYNRSLTAALELEDGIGEGVLHNNMGLAYEMLNNLEQAQEHYEKHLDKMKSYEDIYGQAIALENIAKTYEYMANLTKASETLEQLASLHEQLKQEEERQLVLSRLERLNDLRGMEAKGKAGTGHGAGLKSTWKKLKGKKKKQRNLTAPEISSEDFKAITEEREKKKKSGTLEAVSEEKAGKGKGLFGKHAAGSKEKTREIKKESSVTDQTGAKASPKRMSTSESLRMDTPSSVEDSLSQKSDQRLSQPDHDGHSHTENKGGREQLPSYSVERSTSADGKLSQSKSGDIVLIEDLSQISAGKLSQVSGHSDKFSNSQSGTFTGPDDHEHFSTQSSTRSGGAMDDHLEDERHLRSDFLSNGIHSSERHGPSSDNHMTTTPDDMSLPIDGDSISQLHFGSFRRGCTRMYLEYGNKDHKLNLERVEEFLKSSGETEPIDLNILRDWDGWMMASKDIVIPATTKESQLI